MIMSGSSSSFARASTSCQTQQDWGRGLIFLLPQAAALPGSDAGNESAKPASDLVIQNRQISCSVWCPMYGARFKNVVYGLLRNNPLAIRSRSQTLFGHEQMESSNTSPQTIELNKSYLRKLIPRGLVPVMRMKVWSLDVRAVTSSIGASVQRFIMESSGVR